MNSNAFVDYLKATQKEKQQSAVRELENCEKNIKDLSVANSLASIKLKQAKQNSNNPLYVSATLGVVGIGLSFFVLPLGIMSLVGSATALGLGVYEKVTIKKLQELIEQSKKLEEQMKEYSKYLKSEIGLYDYLMNETEKYRDCPEGERPKDSNQTLEDSARITHTKFLAKQDLLEKMDDVIQNVEKLAKQTGIDLEIEI